MAKTNKEIISELLDIIFTGINEKAGGNMIMLKPALNLVKMKMTDLTEPESAELVDKVHFISRHIEKETGIFSPYHGIDDIETEAVTAPLALNS